MVYNIEMELMLNAYPSVRLARAYTTITEHALTIPGYVAIRYGERDLWHARVEAWMLIRRALDIVVCGIGDQSTVTSGTSGNRMKIVITTLN